MQMQRKYHFAYSITYGTTPPIYTTSLIIYEFQLLANFSFLSLILSAISPILLYSILLFQTILLIFWIYAFDCLARDISFYLSFHCLTLTNF